MAFALGIVRRLSLAIMLMLTISSHTVVLAFESLPVPGVPQDAELKAGGARIGEIRLERRNVFDTAIPEEDTSLFRLLNRLHIQTRESTIKDQLLFKEGDKYDAHLLEESERILRSFGFLREAHIRPIAFHDGIVDIEVVTQDVWTLKPELSFGRKGGTNSGGVGLEDANLLGRGSELGVRIESGIDRDSKSISFRDPQIGGSRWGLATEYASNSDGKTQELSFNHPFYALDTRWAAGAAFRNDDRVDAIYSQGVVVNELKVHERVWSFFGGWSAGLRDHWVTRWTAGLTGHEYHSNPLNTASNTGTLGDDLRLAYPWVGVELIEDKFRKTRNHDQIGRTEDMALGWHTSALLGFASSGLGSDRTAKLFSVSVSRGIQASRLQTLKLAGTAKGRIEQGDLTSTAVGVSGRYYLRQSYHKTFFLSMAVDRVLRMRDEQQLTLGGDNGLRGYPLRYHTGDTRWLMTVEQRIFTNLYPFRLFYVGAAAYLDMGRTWGTSSNGTDSQGMLKDVGIGLRLGNSRSSFGNVVHIDIAYPLDAAKSSRKPQFLLETKRSF